jgi:putative ubiquitin-RnfH superfamily antitoxin RatB of RatAB toxin-antitoxin module
MRYAIYIIMVFLLVSQASATEYQVTPEDIAKAEQVRNIGIKFGLNKPMGDKIFDALKAANGGKLNKELTIKEKTALLCTYKKSQEIEYESKIEIYARYLADPEFARTINAAIDDECGMTGLFKK